MDNTSNTAQGLEGEGGYERGDELIEGVDYSVKHLENRSSIFYHTERATKKFGEDFDKVVNYIQSLILSGASL